MTWVLTGLNPGIRTGEGRLVRAMTSTPLRPNRFPAGLPREDTAPFEPLPRSRLRARPVLLPARGWRPRGTMRLGTEADRRGTAALRSLPIGIARLALPPVLYFLVTLALFGRHATGWFIGDDWQMLAISRWVSGKGLRELLESYPGSAHLWAGYVRPVEHLSWILGYLLTGTTRVWPYYAASFLLHAATASALAAFAGTLGMARPAAVWIGLLFLCHPLVAEPVAHLYGRSDLMLGLFYVSALAAYARHLGTGKMGWLLVAWLLAHLAAFSKELGITLPAAIVAVELLAGEGRPLGRLARSLPFATVVPAWFVYRAWALPEVPLPMEPELDPVAHLRFVLRAVPAILLDPVNRSLLDLPTWLPAALGSALALLLALVALRRSPGWRPALVGLAVAVLPLLPVAMRLHPGSTLRNYRYCYTSAAGASLVLGALVWEGLGRGRIGRRARTVVLVLVLGASAWTLWQHSSPWLRVGRRERALEEGYRRILPDGLPRGATVYLLPRPANRFYGPSRSWQGEADRTILVSGEARYRAPRVLAESHAVPVVLVLAAGIESVEGKVLRTDFDPFRHDWTGGDRLLVWDDLATELHDDTERLRSLEPPTDEGRLMPVVEIEGGRTEATFPRRSARSVRQLDVTLRVRAGPPDGPAVVYLRFRGPDDPVPTALPFEVPRDGLEHAFTLELSTVTEWLLRGGIDRVELFGEALEEPPASIERLVLWGAADD